MIITFAGHKDVGMSEELKARIVAILKKYVMKEEIVFYCGGYGKFDNACAKIVKELKIEYPSIKLFYITPYVGDGAKLRLEIAKMSGYYDDIIYPGLEHVPYKFAISKRNEYMVDAADLLIAFVEHDWGGAYKTLLYAKRKKKEIINLSGVEF